MRQEATAVSDPALGDAFVATYYRAFLVGPGFFAGLANGVILGYLMYRSELVPRGMALLGLIGGPLVMITGIAVMFDVIERGGAVQAIATIPEFFWELSLSIYCIVKGFRLSSPILRAETVTLPESDSALRHEA
jgi:ABC-type nitrate/sulfonate/bicarbonate transport system permease component